MIRWRKKLLLPILIIHKLDRYACFFRPSQKCQQTGYILPPVGNLKRPRQREVRQERLHLPRPPDHARPPGHDQRV